MRKVNKELLPQERLINLLNDMVDMGWEPFRLYEKDYRFSYSDNPDFPYRLSYRKHEREYHIDLTDCLVFSDEAGLIEELLENHMLDVDKFYNDNEPSIKTHYKEAPGNGDFDEEDSFTRSYYLQNQWNSSDRLDEFFRYLIEG